MKKTKKKPREKKSSSLTMTVVFIVVIFIILTITMLIVGVCTYILVDMGIVPVPNLGIFLLFNAIASIAVGTLISVFIAKIPASPVDKLIRGMDSLAAGNYNTRLSLRVPKIGKDLEKSFNILADELQNTEMLRSDFVNNFSHEFKTPLVSIQGFARLLQSENVSEQKKKEYLGIISSESARLADMATKILDLTKLENQSILTDISEYNLSEQLRECILLLERKWTEKNLSISADFSEHYIRGNREMLSQVWINLIDNAVKFAFPDSVLEVSVKCSEDFAYVSVSDCGEVISEEDKSRIFRKFYQSDTSHTALGNGIGLAIAHRIAELHKGEITVESTKRKTTFTVKLPARA